MKMSNQYQTCVNCNEWNYKNPKLKLGYKSIRSECAFYRKKGYEYFILGDDDDKYKKEIQGFELLTPKSKGLYSTL